MLKMLEPTTLPIATAPDLRHAAIIEVTSSGSDVPMATTVSPMAVSEAPNMRAISDAPCTVSQAPTGSPISPPTMNSVVFQVSCGRSATSS